MTLTVMNDVEITRLSWPEDRERFEHFLQRSDAWMPELFKRVSLSEYAAKVLQSGVVLGGRVGTQDCAMVGFYCNDQVSRAGYITYLAVVPECRGKNLGTALLAEAMAEMRQCGMETARLEVRLDNEAARSFYEKSGFSADVAETNPKAKGTQFMVRSLPPAC